jgi:hypothetical protein
MLTLIQAIVALAQSVVGLIRPATAVPAAPITPTVIENTEELESELEK